MLTVKKQQLVGYAHFSREDLPAIIPAGRSETDEFFSKYLRTRERDKKEEHFPFLVFVNQNSEDMPGRVEIHIVQTTSGLLKYPDKAIVMKQWPGKTRSDWFWFTIAELKRAIKSWGNRNEGEG
jgi:hypothetical protein